MQHMQSDTDAALGLGRVFISFAPCHDHGSWAHQHVWQHGVCATPWLRHVHVSAYGHVLAL